MSVPAFDLYAPQVAGTALLVAARVGGLVLVAPVFSARGVPATLRAVLILVLTVVLLPAAAASARAAGPLASFSFAAAVSETMIGFTIGMGAALFIGAAQTAGDLMTAQIGLSGAAVLDPTSGETVPTLGQFLSLFTLATLLGLDFHLVMLDALSATFDIIPAGAPIDVGAGALRLVLAGSQLFLLGLQLAAPVIAAVLIANVSLAILGRAAPQLNILTIAFPVQITLGLVLLVAILPLLSFTISHWVGTYDGVLADALEALRPGAVAAPPTMPHPLSSAGRP